MKTRTKWFLGVLLAVVVLASAITGDAGLLGGLLVLGLSGWFFWRCFVFLSILFKPLREKLRPTVDPINAHMYDTLRRSGLGKVADIGEQLDAGIDGAVAGTQQVLDDRRTKERRTK